MSCWTRSSRPWRAGNRRPGNSADESQSHPFLLGALRPMSFDRQQDQDQTTGPAIQPDNGASPWDAGQALMVAGDGSRSDEPDSFIRAVAHDLKSPLISIEGLLASLHRQLRSQSATIAAADTEESFARIQQSIRRMRSQ